MMGLPVHKNRTAPPTNVNQQLIVECGPMRMSIPGRGIRGLLKTIETTFQDTITLLGETYEKGDLANRFDSTKTVTPFSSQGRTILCSNGVWRKAYAVDRIISLVEIEPSDISPLPPHFRGAEREWFAGLFFFEDNLVLIINLDWLVTPTDVVPWCSEVETGYGRPLESEGGLSSVFPV
jgi:hypothetical protein